MSLTVEAQQSRLQVIDPGNRLPGNFASNSQDTGYLYVPDNGQVIHPQSIARLIRHGVETQRPVGFVPHVPAASELGMPQYKPVAYWLPKTRDYRLRNLWHFTKKAARGVEVTEEEKIRRYLKFEKPELLTETPEEELIFYFVENYAAVAPKPIQVSVVVTNACNLKCVMCPYHSPIIQATHKTDFFNEVSTMDWETMERIAEECGRDKIPVKIGNIEEPLLHPRIVDFIRLARSKGVPTAHITSNGLLLNEERTRELLDAGLTSLYVSIDAARQDTYKRVRGANLEKVERNIETFLRLRKEMGKDCTLMVAFIRNDGVREEEEIEFRNKWAEIVDGVIIYNLVEYEEGSSLIKNINAYTRSYMEKAGGRWACLNPFQEMYILPDGRVYYCCETIGKLGFENLKSMGDYRTGNLRDIWQGPVFRELRRSLLQNQLDDWSACKDCGIWMAHATSEEKRDNLDVITNMITEIFRKPK